MHPRITRIPNYLISLSLIALLAAALVTDQARANLHSEIRASSAFHTSTEEHIDRNVARNTWCRTHRSTLEADAGTMNMALGADAAAGAFADAPFVHRYSTLSPARRARQVANEPR